MLGIELDEINPLYIGMGLIGGILSQVVMSSVQVGLFYKIISFILTTIVCTIMSMKILDS